MTLTLETTSLLAIYSAMALYTIAFIAFTVDLARRSALVQAAVPAAPVGQLATASASGSTTLLEKQADAPSEPPRASKAMRMAMAFTTIGFALHAVGVLLRGLAAGYAPWSNMYGFAITATGVIVGVFLLVQFWQDLKFLGAYIVGFCLAFLGLATVNFYVAVAPQPPALQSTWLVIHVFVAILGSSFFALGGGLSLVQLLQARREARGSGLRFLATLPNALKLENLAYRLILVGFVFWTFTLIAGAVWAERAWGRYWGWDTKEVWTFIIWTIFAGYIHARATRGWRGSRSAWLAIIGFAAVMFNFTIVNLFFKGLHAYSGL